MPPALLLRLRASCLTWRRVEQAGLGLAHPLRQLSNGQPRPKNKKRVKAVEPAPERRANIKQVNSSALLEELFPEAVQRHGGAAPKEREVPRLNLDLPDIPDIPAPQSRSANAHELPLDRVAKWDNYRDTKRQYARLEKQSESISVLVFSNASKDLTEEDFRRVIPQGKHLEGWNLERGDIIKVIPGRDTASLERQNYYYLLFKSPVSAFAYQTHVTRLHKLSQIHTPSSLLSPIPPPPGYLMEGEDIAGMLQSYSLLPPSQEIRVRQLSFPLSPSMRQIVKCHGYPAIADRADKSPAEVLLRLEGPQLPIPIIRSTLAKVARERGVAWTGVEAHHLRVHKWEIRGTNVSPMSSRELDPGRKMDEEKEAAHDETEEPAGDEYQDNLEGNKSGKYFRQRRHAPPSCIIGFQTEAEAQTFVRYWHRRPMEPASYDYDGEMAPIVNAELLW